MQKMITSLSILLTGKHLLAMVKKIKHILVADDEAIYRDIAQEALEKAGNRVTVAADGGEAMALLARDP